MTWVLSPKRGVRGPKKAKVRCSSFGPNKEFIIFLRKVNKQNISVFQKGRTVTFSWFKPSPIYELVNAIITRIEVPG